MKHGVTMAVLLALAAEPAMAQTAENLSLDHGAVWQTLKTGDTTQGFLQIHNSGNMADVLTGWDCSIADATALVGANGKPLQSLAIAPGQTLILTQNGPHLLLESTHDTVDYGSVVPCAFSFQNAGQVAGYLNAVPAPNPKP